LPSAQVELTLQQLADAISVEYEANPNATLASMHNVTYLGEHPRSRAKVSGVGLFFQIGGMSAVRSGNVLFALKWSELDGFGILDQERIRRRVTATRAVLFGAVGLLVRKAQSVCYLVASDAQGEYIFEIPATQVEARARLAPVQQYVTHLVASFEATETGTQASPPSSGDIESRLATLQRLAEQGLISDADYERRKVEILREV
jgi:hypothetical protein